MPLIYVGRHYTAGATTRLKSYFRCQSCGYEADAIVTGIGRGVARGPYFLDVEGARQRAIETAESNAIANAHSILSSGLILCPKCLKREPKAERAFKRKSIVYAVLTFMVCAGVAFLFCVTSDDPRLPAVVFAMIAAIASFLVWLSRRKILDAAVQQVRFQSEGKHQRQIKKKKKKKAKDRASISPR